MNTETLIAEIRKLPPDQRRVVRDFILNGVSQKPTDAELPSLHQVLSNSPFANLEFDPQSIRAAVRPVAL